MNSGLKPTNLYIVIKIRKSVYGQVAALSLAVMLMPVLLWGMSQKSGYQSRAATLGNDIGSLSGNIYNCNKISLNKKVFRPGERVEVKYTDSSRPSAVKLYWANLFAAQPNFYVATKMAWTEIPVTYTAAANQYSGSFIAPAADAEIMIQAVVTSGGISCSGNPIFSPESKWVSYPEMNSDQDGVKLTSKLSAPNPSVLPEDRCDGCQSLLAVVKDDFTTATEDMADYWKMKPGSYWLYDGWNLTYNPTKSFKARIDMENPIKYCGLSAMPVRFTKTNQYGYWGPWISQYSSNQAEIDSESRWQGDLARRWFATAFLDDAKWNDKMFMGSLGGKSYHQKPDTDTDSNPANDEINFRDLGDFHYENQVFFDTPWQNFYFPSYIFSPRYLKTTNDSAGQAYTFDRIDYTFKPYADNLAKTDYDVCEKVPRTWKPADTSSEGGPVKTHGWHFDYKYLAAGVPTPAGVITGPAYRLRFIEYGLQPTNSTSPWSFVHREDWYISKGRGIVRIDGYRISPAAEDQDGRKYGAHWIGNWDQCKQDPECLGRDVFDVPSINPGSNVNKVVPHVSMWLTSYHPLTKFTNFSASADGINYSSAPVITRKTSGETFWYLRSTGSDYTGWVEACTLDTPTSTSCKTTSSDWGWMSKGKITKLLGAPPGTYYARFRPQILSVPSKFETVILNPADNVGWSDQVITTIVK